MSMLNTADRSKVGPLGGALALLVAIAMIVWRLRKVEAPPASPYPAPGAKTSPMPPNPIGPVDVELIEGSDNDPAG